MPNIENSYCVIPNYIFELSNCHVVHNQLPPLKIPEQSNIESISSDFPDLSIVYKLHLECGKFINLYDWMQVVTSIFFVTSYV